MPGRSTAIAAFLLLAANGLAFSQYAPVPTPTGPLPIPAGTGASLGAPIPVLDSTILPTQAGLPGTSAPLMAPVGGSAFPPPASIPPPPAPGIPASRIGPAPAMLPSATGAAPIRLVQNEGIPPPAAPPTFASPPPPPAFSAPPPGSPGQFPPPPAGATNPNMAWWEDTKEALALNQFSKRKLFQSDHAFDVFSSPVSNPFLFQDPRSLTEIKPLFIYNKVPTDNSVFNGSNIFWFGVQGSLAITEKLSVKIDKLGGQWTDLTAQPGATVPGASFYGNNSSFSEVWITPQWTFWRGERTSTVMATGVQFQIPSGSLSAGQGTGGFTINPYFSIAQNFWRTSYGSMNVMGNLGFPISVNGDRNTVFTTSLHLDYDVANWHKLYPSLDLNIQSALSNGDQFAMNTYSPDMFNVGANAVKGLTNVTIAPGVRYKFTEMFQVGGAVEFLTTTHRSMDQFRFIADFIIKY